MDGRIESGTTSATEVICNVCRGTDFAPKFASPHRFDGRQRRCLNCGTHDRQRASYEVYSLLRPLLVTWRVAQFAPDGSVNPHWFAEYVFVGARAGSTPNVELTPDRYELVIANHTLGLAPDDVSAMGDLLRLVGAHGVVQLSVPSPLWQWETMDWGHADPAKHNRYRSYGAEFGAALCQQIDSLHGMAVIGTDPVNLSQELLFFFSFDEAVLAAIGYILQRRPIPIVRFLPAQAMASRVAQPRPAAPIATKAIGIDREGYPEARNITSLNAHRASFVVAPSDFSRVPPNLRAWMDRSEMMRENTVCPVPDPTIDCYHFFNAIPVNDVPFVCTFETSLPRWAGVDEDTWRIGLDILASDRCRRLFALSSSAVEFMRGSLWRYGAEITNRIMSKVDLVYPPQALPPRPVDQRKFERRTLDLVFVGRDFLRKGGYELVRAAERLLARGADLRLHLVTHLAPASDGAGFAWNIDADRKLARARKVIDRFPDRIRLSGPLSQTEVLDLFAAAHIAILPSFHDTFGYSVLEAQSRSCAVVTTGQRAFAEINNPNVGWIIDLPVDAKGRFECSAEAFADVSADLTGRIVDTLDEVLATGMDLVRIKAARGHKRIRVFHDPQAVENHIYAYY